MRIGILADTHNNSANLRKALAILRAARVEHVFHCGDLTDPALARALQEFPTSFVLGNNDDEEEVRRAVLGSGNSWCGRLGTIVLGGKRFAFTHGDDSRLLRAEEHSGRHDFLFYGHTHKAEQHRTGPTLVVNPGALHRARVKSLALLDPSTGEAAIVPIP